MPRVNKKSIWRSETLWFLGILLAMMIYSFWRIQRFYDKALEGTKMQVLRTPPLPKANHP